YFLVAGRPPYRDEGFRTTLVKQLTHAPDPLDPDELGLPTTRAVEAVIHKAMSPGPEDRYQTASELLADLDTALRLGETVADRPSRVKGKQLEAWTPLSHPGHVPAAPAAPRASSRWLRFGVGVLAAGLLAVGGWLLSRPSPDPDKQPR